MSRKKTLQGFILSTVLKDLGAIASTIEITWEGSKWAVVYVKDAYLYFFRLSGWNKKYIDVTYDDTAYVKMYCERSQRPHRVIEHHIENNTHDLQELKSLVLEDSDRWDEIQVNLLPGILKYEFCG
jgi:hypothetical protein